MRAETLPTRTRREFIQTVVGGVGLAALPALGGSEAQEFGPVNPRRVEEFVNKFGSQVINKVEAPGLNPNADKITLEGGTERFYLSATFTKDKKEITQTVQVTRQKDGSLSGITFDSSEGGVYSLARNPDGRNWHYMQATATTKFIYASTQKDDPEFKNDRYEPKTFGRDGLKQIEEKFSKFVKDIINQNATKSN